MLYLTICTVVDSGELQYTKCIYVKYIYTEEKVVGTE